MGDARIVAYFVPRSAEGGNNDRGIELWPSVGEYPVFDDLAYHALSVDSTRTGAFRRAFDRLVRGKTVLDLGTGANAMLARECLEAGARKVYGVEIAARVAETARERVRALGLADRIETITGDIQDVSLPEPVDVVVSGILESIGGAEGAAVLINAARRHLREGGIVIPQVSTTRIAAATLPPEISAAPAFTEVSGHYVKRIFDAVGHRFDLRLCIRNFPAANLLSSSAEMERLDFSRPVPTASSHIISLRVERNGIFDGLLLWLALEMGADERLETLSSDTAWFPAFFPLFSPGVPVYTGDHINAVCRTTLSDDGLHPDYHVEGELVSARSGRHAFAFRSYHHTPSQEPNPFMQRLFRGDDVRVRPAPKTIEEALRKTLQAQLPDYMMPSALVAVAQIPRTAAGKVDRKALPTRENTSDLPYCAPRSPDEARLCQLFAEILNAEKVGIHDDFFELGGHSILAMSLIARLKEETGLEISIRHLFETPTVAGLVETALVDRVGEVVGDPFAVLISLRSAGERPPLFCVHPAGGLSWCYSPLLKHIPPEYPLYGLQSRGMHDTRTLPASLKEMAEDYVAEMRRIQPVGPYHLLGWSLGGDVAHVMATLLQGTGEQVALLAVIDSFPVPSPPPEVPASPPEERPDFLLPVLKMLDAPPEIIRYRAEVMRHHRHLKRTFAPTPFAGDLLLVASRNPQGKDADVERREQIEVWRPFVLGSIDIHSLAVPHGDLMTKPGPVAMIGRLIAAALERASAAGGSAQAAMV